MGKNIITNFKFNYEFCLDENGVINFSVLVKLKYKATYEGQKVELLLAKQIEKEDKSKSIRFAKLDEIALLGEADRQLESDDVDSIELKNKNVRSLLKCDNFLDKYDNQIMLRFNAQNIHIAEGYYALVLNYPDETSEKKINILDVEYFNVLNNKNCPEAIVGSN